MPRKKISFDTVRELGRALPDVEEGTVYGSPALKVRGKMFACLAVHRSAEPNSLVVLIGFDQRDELIASDPMTYYLRDHYVNYPVALVRLTRVHHDALRDLLHMAWRFVSMKAKRRVGRPTPR
ncbi:MAG: MmcQ/YjbR family DNA-binding protein [Vicinamibacterales bacterium]